MCDCISEHVHVIEMHDDNKQPVLDKVCVEHNFCGGAASACGFFHSETSSENSVSMKRLWFELTLGIVFMSIEVVGGFKANSLALLSDASQLLSDVASFAMSLFAIWASGWKPNPRQSYGFLRIEILGGLNTILMTWLLAGILVFEAITRFIKNENEVQGFIMFLVSAFGLGVNITMAAVLGHDHHLHGHDHDHGQDHAHEPAKHEHPHPHQSGCCDESLLEKGCCNCEGERKSNGGWKKKQRNINLQGAYLHVLGDSIQSIGVMIGGAVIWYKPEWKVADLICTLIFSVIVLVTTIKTLLRILEVLMESTPKEIDANTLAKGLCEMDEILSIHELHIWSITVGKTLLTCHIMVKHESDHHVVLEKVVDYIRKEYSIHHVTIQVEK